MPSISSFTDHGRSHHTKPSNATSLNRPPPTAATRASGSLGGVLWPFQSVRASEYSTSPPSGHVPRNSFFQPISWGFGANRRPPSSVVSADIVPDYVIHFMRGETPESLAAKRKLQGSPQVPKVEDRPRVHRSMTADFYLDQPDVLNDANAYDNELSGGAAPPLNLKMLTTGWRGGMLINLLLVMVAFAVGLVSLIMVVLKTGEVKGQYTVQTGACSAVNGSRYGVSVVVNVLGLTVLACANYTFQVLSSPTRAEVDMAHRQFSWVNIGIPSLRNLLFINGFRATLAVITVVLAVASQVIYNSLVTVTATAGDECSLVVNKIMLVVIVALNMLLALVMALTTLGRSRLDPLITVGDAIACFLTNSDRTTQGECLLQQDELAGRHGRGVATKTWEPKSHRWMHAASALRWTMGWLVFWVTCAGLSAATLAVTLIHDKKSAFKAFDRVNSVMLFRTGPPDAATALVAALPHIVFAALYLSTNALVTMFFVSHEFSLFAIPGNLLPLRVSNGAPLGAQTSSRHLTLPRVYSAILMFFFLGIGFLVSQSAYLVAVEEEKDDNGLPVAAIGVSPLPLVALLGLLGVVGFFVAGLSLRRTDPNGSIDAGGEAAGNPLALRGGSSSLIISSRCQRSPLEDEDMVTRPVGWGVVRMATNWHMRHAAFSNNPRSIVHVGSAYL